MDDLRFDAVSRALGGATSRRGAVAALTGLLAGGIAGDAAQEDRAGADGQHKKKRKKRKKRCNPACPYGQICRKGVCACDNGGTVCGADCCVGGEICQGGQCVAPEPECAPLGGDCVGTPGRCCAGLTCASGQAGEEDVACYVPAGGACDTDVDCVFDTTCTDGVCVEVVHPTPPPQRECTFRPTGDAAADGETLRALVENPAGPNPILLCPGVYRASRRITVLRDLQIEPANPRDGAVILDGGWSGGNATDGHQVVQVGDSGQPAATVGLSGITVRNGFSTAIINSQDCRLMLSDVAVSTCRGVFGGCIANAGTLEIVRGSIVGGIALSGAGIYNSGSLTVTDGLITECDVSGSGAWGAGLYNSGSATLTRTTISDCTAVGYIQIGTTRIWLSGGGIANFGTLDATGAAITGCTAPGGGGLYNQNASATLTGCTITGCTATHDADDGDDVTNKRGGAVQNTGSLTLTGGSITGCQARVGGGLHNTGTANLSGVAIADCIASGGAAPSGGGIENAGTGARLTVSGGTITGCRAAYGGGIDNDESTSAAVTGATISGCSATSEGGGIYNRAPLTLGAGTVIRGNSAGTAGAGIYNDVSTATCSGSPAPGVCGNPTGGPYANCAGTALGTGCTGVCAAGAC